ncbi:MAG: sensor histidine kinase [Rhodospirillales bacterium]|nr:sensor histidine kinase [Rhodospirillales bacterium]
MANEARLRTDPDDDPRRDPARAEPGAAPEGSPGDKRPAGWHGAAVPRPGRRTRRRRFSPLTRRILFLNSVALAILVVGLLYLDDYRRSLVAAEIAALTTQGKIIAAALGEAASDTGNSEAGIADRLAPEPARQILRRLVEATHTRARLFAVTGEIIADTRVLTGPGGVVQVAPLPPPTPPPDMLTAVVNAIYDVVVNWLPSRDVLPPYRENPEQRARDYPEVQAALAGDIASATRATGAGGDDHMVLAVAVPVQRFKQVLGVLMLTSGSGEIERNLRDVRFDILKVFVVALAITALISLYLAGTIARPIRRLALAADRVRGGQGLGVGRGRGETPAIPDMSQRGDEIGDLSAALIEMTQALWQRLDAIERFAADVAHEIKNPLTSLKSAVETAARVKDPVQQRRLMAIILEDVARLDRLIGDISNASRLDAELSRAEIEPVDLAALLQALVNVHATTARPGDPRVALDAGGNLVVPGLENRLGQVFRNLIANAVSFSPPDGTIRISALRRGATVETVIEDEGPGIPPDKLEAIFERFYSERPKGEKFGTHSGLGLSISRQIVLAHDGTISAENRHDAHGRVVGARFRIRLPVE